MKLEKIRSSIHIAANRLIEPTDPRPIALVRLIVGLFVVIQAIGFIRHRELLFGAHGLIDLPTARLGATFVTDHIFVALDWNRFLSVVLGLHLVSVILTTLGLWTNWVTPTALVTMLMLEARNPFIVQVPDRIAHTILFFGWLAQWGNALSIDAWLGRIRTTRRWPVWLLMVTISVIYFHQTRFKLLSGDWRSGEALYYILRQESVLRFPIPAILDQLWILKLATYATIAIEGLLAGPIWLPWSKWRRTLVALGIGFHLAAEWTLSIPFVQWYMIALLTLWWPRQSQVESKHHC